MAAIRSMMYAGEWPAREDVPDIVTTLKDGGYLTGILGKVAHSTPKKSMQWDYHFDQKDLGNGRNPEIYYQKSYCIGFITIINRLHDCLTFGVDK